MKRLISIFALVALTTVAAMAQTAAAAGNTDVKLFGLEAGVSVGYTINGTTTAGTSFGANLVVADNMTVGFMTTNIGVSYNLLKLSYFLTPALGLSTYIGRSATPNTSAGLGVFFNVGKNASTNGLASAYKVKLDYLFETNNLTAGTVAVTAAIQLGI